MIYLGPLARRGHRLVDAQRRATASGQGWLPPASPPWLSSPPPWSRPATIADYWSHPHFVKVRSTSFDFWQNLQFVIPLIGLAICGGDRTGSGRPGCRAGDRWSSWASPPSRLVLSPWYRLLDEHSILYPPAHYLARQAAGMLLALLLVCMWLHVAWQRRRRRCSSPCACRRSRSALSLAMTVLVIAAAVPDVALTGLWSDYLGRMRALVDDRAGHHPRARPAAARLAGQALRPGLVAAAP